MSWVKATDTDGDVIWLNVSLARAVRPNTEGGGSTVIFDAEDAYDVKESVVDLLHMAGEQTSHIPVYKPPQAD